MYISAVTCRFLFIQPPKSCFGIDRVDDDGSNRAIQGFVILAFDAAANRDLKL